jgi:hypothetical protein
VVYGSPAVCLHHAIGHGAVLGLSTQAGYDVLMLRRLGDEVGAEENSVARGGLACVWVSHPICISVDHQLGGGRVSQEEAKIQGVPIQGVHVDNVGYASWR